MPNDCLTYGVIVVIARSIFNYQARRSWRTVTEHLEMPCWMQHLRCTHVLFVDRRLWRMIVSSVSNNPIILLSYQKVDISMCCKYHIYKSILLRYQVILHKDCGKACCCMNNIYRQKKTIQQIVHVMNAQELVHLFHDISTTQRYHALSTPQDLPADFGISLWMAIARLPNRILSILHLHRFHSFVEQIPPATIYPPFWHIFLHTHDYGTTWSLHLPVWTPSIPFTITALCPCSKLSCLIITCTAILPCSVWHFFLSHCCRTQIQLGQRCCSYQPLLCHANGPQSSCYLCSYSPPQCSHHLSPHFCPHWMLLVLWYRSLSRRLPPVHLSSLSPLRPWTFSNHLSVYPMQLLQPMGT